MILKCYYSNESYRTVLCCAARYYAQLHAVQDNCINVALNLTLRFGFDITFNTLMTNLELLGRSKCPQF